MKRFSVENIEIKGIDHDDSMLFKGGIPLGEVIILNEDGFSEPVGIFNKVTRVAVLTTNIQNKTLKIEGNNIILDGRGYKFENTTEFPSLVIGEEREKITVRHIKINALNTNILIERNCEDILIEKVDLAGEGFTAGVYIIESRGVCIRHSNISNFFGVDVFGGRGIIVNHNRFSKCQIGVLLFSAVTESSIVDNLFSNCKVGVDAVQTATLNTVKNNKIVINEPINLIIGIRFLIFNSYNVIENNSMTVEKIFYERYNEEDIEINSVFISLAGQGNVGNKVINNKYKNHKNRYFLRGVESFKYSDYGIVVENPNAENEVCENFISFTENEINSEGSVEIGVVVENVIFDLATGGKLKNNSLKISDNKIIYTEGNLDLTTENLYCGRQNHCLFVCENSFLICGNTVNDNPNITVSYEFNNIRLADGNRGGKIKNNNFNMHHNTKGVGCSILFEEDNMGNEVENNNFTDIQGDGVILQVNNIANIVGKNIIEVSSWDSVGVKYIQSNNSNIISNNVIRGINVGISFDTSNLYNVITHNFFNEQSIGIEFKENSNVKNTIVSNAFTNVRVPLSNVDKKENYVYPNEGK